MPKSLESTLEYWKTMVTLGIKYRRDYSTYRRWEDFKKYYRHEFSEDSLPYNITYATAGTIIPSVYYRNPYIMVSPRKEDVNPMHAWIVASCDNWLIDELNLKKQMRRCALDTFLFGYSMIKIGYEDSILRGLTSEEDIYEASLREKSKPGELSRVNYNIRVRDEMPWALRVSPEDVVFPWGMQSIDNTPWIGHSIITLTEDLKENKRFYTEGLEGSRVEAVKDENNNKRNFFSKVSSDMDFTEYYEISDYKRGQVCAFCPSWDKWMLKPQVDDLQIEGLNWVYLSFTDDPDYIFSTPECAIIEPQQLEMNEARYQAQLHRKLALLKFLYKKGVIKNLGQLLSGEVGPGVEVDGNPREDIALLQPHIPADLVAWVDKISVDVERIIGISEVESGGLAGGRKTATEIAVSHGGFNLRIGDKRGCMGDAIKSVIEKWNDLIFQRWSMERVTEVVGVDGARYWVRHTMKELKGDYDIKIDVDSLSPTTKTIKRKEIMELLSTLVKVPGANIMPLVSELSREYGFLNVKELLPQAPETMGGPMGLNQFMSQQAGLQRNPQQRQSRIKGYQGM